MDFGIINGIDSRRHNERYRKIGLVPLLANYEGGGGGRTVSVFHDTSMFNASNISISSSGSNFYIGYNDITINSRPIYENFAQKYSTLNTITNKYTNFSNTAIVKTDGDYYGVPLVYVSQTDGWKPVELMPHLWRNMEPFFFQNEGNTTITIKTWKGELAPLVGERMYGGSFVPPSGGVRWCLYDATIRKFVDVNGEEFPTFYYPYNYEWSGRQATPYINGVNGKVLTQITVKPGRKIYVIRCDNDLTSSLNNQLRADGSMDYSSLFESLRFETTSTGSLKIGGNIASLFFPYTTQINSYTNIPVYDNEQFLHDLETSIFGGAPVHWNFGYVKETSPQQKWLGVHFNGGRVNEIADPVKKEDKNMVTDGTPSEICLNYRNYSLLFSGLHTCLVDACEIEFPVLYDTVSRDIYTQRETRHAIILEHMFGGCYNLLNAPREIPYIQGNAIGASYAKMFSGCTSLTVSPLIYTHKDTGNTFYDMFGNCPLTKLLFRTSKRDGEADNEIGDLFGESTLGHLTTNLVIYKLKNVTYMGSRTNFNGFCGHQGTVEVRDILTSRDAFGDTYQHYKF